MQMTVTVSQHVAAGRNSDNEMTENVIERNGDFIDENPPEQPILILSAVRSTYDSPT